MRRPTPPPGEPLHPVATYFPGRSDRWIAESCRAGRIPGAVLVGRQWLIRQSSVDELVAGAAPRPVPTVDEATADLRARGVL